MFSAIKSSRPVNSARRAMLICLFAQISHYSYAADLDEKAIKRAVEGVYELEEWHTSTAKYLPPTVEGRLIFLNGNVLTVLRNQISPTTQIRSIGFGTYSVAANQLSYVYNDWTTVTENNEGVTVTHKLPWEGMRKFAATTDGNAVSLRTQSGEDFTFNSGEIKYSQNGRLLRLWRRVESTK